VTGADVLTGARTAWGGANVMSGVAVGATDLLLVLVVAVSPEEAGALSLKLPSPSQSPDEVTHLLFFVTLLVSSSLLLV